MAHNIEPLLNAIAQSAIEQQLKLTTAESCTGGWIAKCLTDLPGSSNWFDCGFVTYSNHAKQSLLGVDAALIENYGAVSQPVVEAMCQGALRNSLADWSVAVSGIAGPGGGTIDKPVGTVWIGWMNRTMTPVSRCYQFEGNRDSIRSQTVFEALKELHALIIEKA
jgi:nicotinamide-nucleotide amidase